MDWTIRANEDEKSNNNDIYTNFAHVDLFEQEYYLQHEPIENSIQIGLMDKKYNTILKTFEGDSINFDELENKVIFPSYLSSGDQEEQTSKRYEWIVKYEFIPIVFGTSKSSESQELSEQQKFVDFNDKLNEAGWMPIDYKIGLVWDFEDYEDWTRAQVYLHCFDRSENLHFVVKAMMYSSPEDDEKYKDPKEWELRDESKNYSSHFENCEILEWMPSENEKIGGILFTYDDLDGSWLAEQFPGDFGFPECGERSRTVHCIPENIDENINSLICSNEYLNYDDILIASDDISQELAEKIDSLDYKPFTLFGHSQKSEWLKKYDWCNIDTGKSKSLLYDIWVEEKYGWGIEEGYAMLDVVDALVLGELSGRGEYSDTLKIANALYEKWGTEKFLQWLGRFWDYGSEIDLGITICDEIVNEYERLDRLELDRLEDEEDEIEKEEERIQLARQKFDEVTKNKKAEFTQDDLKVSIRALDLMSDLFYEKHLMDDIENVEFDFYHNEEGNVRLK